MTFSRKKRAKDMLLQAAALMDRGAGLPLTMQLGTQTNKWLENPDSLELLSKRMLKMQRQHTKKASFNADQNAPIEIFREESSDERPSIALQQDVSLGEETQHAANF